MYCTKCKTMKKFENGNIEINDIVYGLVDINYLKDIDSFNCCDSCDAKSYCHDYNLHELCKGTGKIFKEHVLEFEGLKYVAKLNSDNSSTCSLCDIPKSECAKHNLVTTCDAINTHAYFKYVGNAEQNGKEHKNIHEKRKFNPKNCQRSIKDRFAVGDITFTLSCHHSFEWTIAKTENGKITIEVYPNRNAAKKEYERKKKLSK